VIKSLPEAHEKGEEEPYLGPDPAAADPLRESLAPQLLVAHAVHHEHGDGAEHAAQVEHVPAQGVPFSFNVLFTSVGRMKWTAVSRNLPMQCGV